MRDVARRLAALEGRFTQQGPRWDFSHLTDEELEFVQSFRGVTDIADVSPADAERLERILLSAGLVKGAA